MTTKSLEKLTVSVALCTYNGATYLREQLESISRQTYPVSEIIISDDGSTDATADIVKLFSAQEPGLIKWIQEGGQLGVTKNFGRAIANCNSDIIFLSDQDDIWELDKVQKTIEAFETNTTCGYVFSDARLITSDGKTTSDSLWETIGFNDVRRKNFEFGEQIPVLLKNGNFVYGMALAFRSRHRDILLPIASISADCTHDTWIATLLSAAGHRGVAVSKRLVRYRQHAMQVVGAGQFKASTWEAVRDALATNRRVSLALADDYEKLADRLWLISGKSSNIIKSTHKVREKALHLKNRSAAVQASRAVRIKLIASELLSGRYTKYSSSWKSALRDMAA